MGHQVGRFHSSGRSCFQSDLGGPVARLGESNDLVCIRERASASWVAIVQTALGERPFSGDVFVFRGKRGDLVKLVWWSGYGMNLYAKRLERGRFVWPQAASGAVHLSPAQLSMLLEGIDWRRPARTWQPQMVV